MLGATQNIFTLKFSIFLFANKGKTVSRVYLYGYFLIIEYVSI